MTDPMRLAAATVLYEPDATLVISLCAALQDAATPLFAVCNSILDADIRDQLLRSGVTLLGDGTNTGLGAGLNAAVGAAESAGFSHVILFDQDSTPTPQLLDTLLERAGSMTAPLGAIGPRLTPPPGEGYRAIWYSDRGGGLPNGQPVDFLPTSGSLLSITAWRTVGPFREDFFIDGVDIEWCFRAWSKGFQIILATDLAMIHRWGQPAGTLWRPQIFRQGHLRNAYYIRNNVYSLRMPHLPMRWKMRTLTRIAAQTLALCVTGGGRSAMRAIRAGWKGELGVFK